MKVVIGPGGGGRLILAFSSFLSEPDIKKKVVAPPPNNRTRTAAAIMISFFLPPLGFSYVSSSVSLSGSVPFFSFLLGAFLGAFFAAVSSAPSFGTSSLALSFGASFLGFSGAQVSLRPCLSFSIVNRIVNRDANSSFDQICLGLAVCARSSAGFSINCLKTSYTVWACCERVSFKISKLSYPQ